MTAPDGQPARGIGIATSWQAHCKDCARELADGGEIESTQPDLSEIPGVFRYDGGWAEQRDERGESRSDRCTDCRRRHQRRIHALAVPYVDLDTIGVVPDPAEPTGPLGGLGPLPPGHTQTRTEVDLADYEFGMTDAHVLSVLARFAGTDGRPPCRVMVLKAGTGTGKSTFLPYRLHSPPEGAPVKLLDRGPIVVTQPRVMAATGPSTFVAEHLFKQAAGPGQALGWAAGGVRNFDAANELVFVTDGAFLNWLRDGKLASIGTVVIDEVHERNANIDAILALLNDQLERHPHLRIILASATMDVEFFVQFFGGRPRADTIEVPPVKTFGFGQPLWPQPDPTEIDLTNWQETGPPAPGGTEPEDLRATTETLLPLRSPEAVADERDWLQEMPRLVAEQCVRLIEGTEVGDVLGFLPTQRLIDEAIELARPRIGDADIYALHSHLSDDEKLAATSIGSRRKVVIATNIAETSLTIDGIRYVVDSGLQNSKLWDPESATESFLVGPHSRAGAQQRWGRVGRKAPGWVFPLYTREQYERMAQDTPAGSTNSNLEKVLMTAKACGVDRIEELDWPADFTHPEISRDEVAERAADVFVRERRRAARALTASGALDEDGHLTELGVELQSFPGSASAAIAVALADQLACAPEVIVALGLLDEPLGKGPRPTKLVDRDGLLRSFPPWPNTHLAQATAAHRVFAAGCRDDLDLALRIYDQWEASGRDPDWSRRWWVNHDLLTAVAATVDASMGRLAAAMRDTSYLRGVSPELFDRARAVLAVAFRDLTFDPDDGRYRQRSEADASRWTQDQSRLVEVHGPVIAFRREQRGSSRTISSLVSVPNWTAGVEDAFGLVQALAVNPGSDPVELPPRLLLDWPVGTVVRADICTGQPLERVELCYGPPVAPPPQPDEPPEDMSQATLGQVNVPGAEQDSTELDYHHGDEVEDGEDDVSEADVGDVAAPGQALGDVTDRADLAPVDDVASDEGRVALPAFCHAPDVELDGRRVLRVAGYEQQGGRWVLLVEPWPERPPVDEPTSSSWELGASFPGSVVGFTRNHTAWQPIVEVDGEPVILSAGVATADGESGPLTVLPGTDVEVTVVPGYAAHHPPELSLVPWLRRRVEASATQSAPGVDMERSGLTGAVHRLTAKNARARAALEDGTAVEALLARRKGDGLRPGQAVHVAVRTKYADRRKYGLTLDDETRTGLLERFPKDVQSFGKGAEPPVLTLRNSHVKRETIRELVAALPDDPELVWRLWHLWHSSQFVRFVDPELMAADPPTGLLDGAPSRWEVLHRVPSIVALELPEATTAPVPGADGQPAAPAPDRPPRPTSGAGLDRAGAVALAQDQVYVAREQAGLERLLWSSLGWEELQAASQEDVGLVAVSDLTDHVSLAAVTRDGQVVVARWVPGTRWRAWAPIGNPGVAIRDVAVLSTGLGEEEVLLVGDGRVWSSWQQADEEPAGWMPLAGGVHRIAAASCPPYDHLALADDAGQVRTWVRPFGGVWREQAAVDLGAGGVEDLAIVSDRSDRQLLTHTTSAGEAYQTLLTADGRSTSHLFADRGAARVAAYADRNRMATVVRSVSGQLYATRRDIGGEWEPLTEVVSVRAAR